MLGDVAGYRFYIIHMAKGKDIVQKVIQCYDINDRGMPYHNREYLGCSAREEVGAFALHDYDWYMEQFSVEETVLLKWQERHIIVKNGGFCDELRCVGLVE